jgi:hypothetical protein
MLFSELPPLLKSRKEGARVLRRVPGLPGRLPGQPLNDYYPYPTLNWTGKGDQLRAMLPPGVTNQQLREAIVPLLFVALQKKDRCSVASKFEVASQLVCYSVHFFQESLNVLFRNRRFRCRHLPPRVTA